MAGQDTDQLRWVHGSWVNVRARPASKATILTQLPANTQVQLDAAASSQQFCAIRWGEGQQGFVACNLLGTQALRLEDVDEDSPGRSPARAFWLEPGLRRLLSSGEYFQATMLSEKQKTLETAIPRFAGERRPPIKRFPIPEFEAMKQRMRDGVIGARMADMKAPAPWVELQKLAHAQAQPDKQTLTAATALNINLFYPGILVMLRQLELPPARPSYFTSLSDIARPLAGPEEISAQFQLSYAIRVLDGPYWTNYETAGVTLRGWWDIGKLDVFLQTPVQKHVLMLDGKLKSETSIPRYKISDEQSGKDGFRAGGPATQQEPVKNLTQRVGSTTASTEPVFYFYSKSQLSPALPADFKWTWGQPKELQYDTKTRKQLFEQFTKAAVHGADLDGDGVADFALVEAWHVAPFSAFREAAAAYRMIFVNAGGNWYLFDIDRYDINGE
ncbi:SH3 domain-containing protein [Undibacterium sp. TS12]|uniref:SH3 domain-containing protein n=1 Tax=Undibacterium sp. TS12 TaxID=2908202 RepID=UPI001F4CED36|nr:SH3 domain-containing protein [Undibacterium sp. TS12]MCH8621603.1 SH3 domain-containing protein [Undibacterium sp. TS12]